MTAETRTATNRSEERAEIGSAEGVAAALRTKRRLVLSSHARPDGDSIGSQLALAFALRHLGKDVRIVNADPPPSHFRGFPGVGEIEVAAEVSGEFDAAVILECSELDRTGVAGLDRYFVVNVDHHLGNTGYGAERWIDESAAACTELVAEVIEALGVPLTPEIGTHIYLGILTDTGSFHHSHISARTFEICRKVVEGGADPLDVARHVYHSGSLGRLRLIGALLDRMELAAGGRVAVLDLDKALLQRTGSTIEETDGLINLPLEAREVQAVVMFKNYDADGAVRVSLRSKGDLDVRAVALAYGGGGHRNAAGFTLPDRLDGARARVVADVAALCAPDLAS